MKIFYATALILSCLFFNVKAQQDTLRPYRLYIDLPIIDVPFLKDAAKMNVDKYDRAAVLKGSPKFGNYINAFESPSMQQALAITTDLHAVNYYLNNRLWDKIIKPTSKSKKIWNRVVANASAGLIDLLFTYEAVVFSPQWMHEEFHRNGLTQRGIGSYNETYNRFNGSNANGSVSRVRDEDLIAFKKEAPQELVRSFSAGIESEYLLLRNLQKDNFYRAAQYPNVLLNILLTKHAVDYVNQFKQAGFNASIDSMNYHGGKIADRDFVGWDFTAWVYDLHRPNEPYQSRGIHPSGNGINRAIKTTDLTTEEYNYLSKMGKLQYLNFLSPMLLGINKIKLNKNLSFNLAVRHYLNSFGYDISTDIMIQYKNKPYFFSFHGYNNRNRFFPGIEIDIPQMEIGITKNKLMLQPTLLLWLQPENQSFYTQKAQTGGAVQLKMAYPIGKQFNIYTVIDSKTKGWVAGNPYLKAATSARFGVSMELKK